MSKKKNEPILPQNVILIQVGLLCASILAILTLTINYFGDRIAGDSSFVAKIQVGLMLFAAWLVISSGMRAAFKMNRQIPSVWLFVLGLGIGILAHMMQSLGYSYLMKRTVDEAVPFFASFFRGFLPALSVSAFIAIMSVIALKVANPNHRIALQVLLVVVLILLILYGIK
ncbi:MAG TPA: hypothetical protein PKA00_18490 [Saprospiraceae bacterium]|nr:hypothetical protein [Saprospiraceae bacterium]HMQ84908.1 hypothetical protein [Saprospiraceae bacterium]